MNTRIKRLRTHATSKRTGQWLCGSRMPLPKPANGDVTCHVCLYHLGLYMPLSKLHDHQDMQRMRGRLSYNNAHVGQSVIRVTPQA